MKTAVSFVSLTPPDPAALLDPDDLSLAYETADVFDGELPRWRRDDPPEPLVPPDNPKLEAMFEVLKTCDGPLPPGLLDDPAAFAEKLWDKTPMRRTTRRRRTEVCPGKFETAP